MAQEHVVLLAGPMGAGKTTAIGSLSEIPVVRTEAVNSDLAHSAKATTTVALDYGEITLDDGDKVRLYGVPGQERFDFMWKILQQRSLGLILLLDNGARDPLSDLDRYLAAFAQIDVRGAVVVGVTRTDLFPQPEVERYHGHLSAAGRVLPVFRVDARDRAQMLTVLGTLVALVEARQSGRVASALSGGVGA